MCRRRRTARTAVGAARQFDQHFADADDARLLLAHVASLASPRRLSAQLTRLRHSSHMRAIEAQPGSGQLAAGTRPVMLYYNITRIGLFAGTLMTHHHHQRRRRIRRRRSRRRSCGFRCRSGLRSPACLIALIWAALLWAHALSDRPMHGELRFHNLTLGYERHPAVHHLSGAVETGALIAVVGPNGAGKSTLFKGIVGAIKPLAGAIDRDGFDAARHRLSAAGRRDRPHVSDQCLRHGGDGAVAAQRPVRRHRPARIATRIEAAIAAVGLTGFERARRSAPCPADRCSACCSRACCCRTRA